MSTVSALPATLWQRIKAFALDYLVISGYLILLLALGVWLNAALPAVSQTLFTNRITRQVISFMLVTLPVTLYFARLESSPQQATWGKRKVGLQVVRTDGACLDFARALGRTLLKFIPWNSPTRGSGNCASPRRNFHLSSTLALCWSGCLSVPIS